jgi:CHAT domain
MSVKPKVKKILFLAANPDDTPRLHLAQEFKQISENLQRSKYRDRFKLDSQLAVQPDKLRQALLESKPQIVHFCGHGAGSQGLEVESRTGKAQYVSTEALVDLFKLFTEHVECVLLSACSAEVQAEAIAQHINYAIGMSDAISDKAAIKFAEGFYDALWDGQSIEKAYEFGCNAIELEGIPGHLIPVLKTKPGLELSNSKVVAPITTNNGSCNGVAPHQLTSGEASVKGLRKISTCEDTHRCGDLIFVHGLSGDARSTWLSQDHGDGFWPAWLGEDLPGISIWTLGYDVSSLPWKDKSMPLASRATNLLHHLSTQGIGNNPLIFITHDLGGLLVKQMLNCAWNSGNPEWEAIADQTKGIVFLSAPNSSNDIEHWIEYLKKSLSILMTNKELTLHNGSFRNLNFWYQSNRKTIGIRTQVYYGEQTTGGISVIDSSSADPEITGVTPILIDDTDHTSISQLHSREDTVYRSVKQFIQSCFATNIQKIKDGFCIRDSQDRTFFLPENPPSFCNLSNQIDSDSMKAWIKAWKDVHHLSEILYSKFLRFHDYIIRADEAVDPQKKQNYIKDSERYINVLKDEVDDLVKQLAVLPHLVTQTKHIEILSNMPEYFNAIKQVLGLNFELVKQTSDVIQKWLYQTLHLADQILKEHFENQYF